MFSFVDLVEGVSLVLTPGSGRQQEGGQGAKIVESGEPPGSPAVGGSAPCPRDVPGGCLLWPQLTPGDFSRTPPKAVSTKAPLVLSGLCQVVSLQ